MMRKYFAWVSRIMTSYEHRGSYPDIGGGRSGATLVTILATLPIWLAGGAIYLAPLPFSAKYWLWIILLVVVIIFALRTAWVLSRQNNRNR